MKLIKLLWADIFRDGGSYGAEFSTDEDSNYNLFLQCSRMPDENGLHHRWLFEYRGSSYEVPENCLPVLSGSNEEQQIIERLKSFLKTISKFEDEDIYNSDNYRRRQLEKLLHYIPLREPCFSSDVKANFQK